MRYLAIMMMSVCGLVSAAQFENNLSREGESIAPTKVVMLSWKSGYCGWCEKWAREDMPKLNKMGINATRSKTLNGGPAPQFKIYFRDRVRSHKGYLSASKIAAMRMTVPKLESSKSEPVAVPVPDPIASGETKASDLSGDSLDILSQRLGVLESRVTVVEERVEIVEEKISIIVTLEGKDGKRDQKVEIDTVEGYGDVVVPEGDKVVAINGKPLCKTNLKSNNVPVYKTDNFKARYVPGNAATRQQRKVRIEPWLFGRRR
jgi:hypothetical protein